MVRNAFVLHGLRALFSAMCLHELVCVRVCALVCKGRRAALGVGSLVLPCGSQQLNSSCRAW